MRCGELWRRQACLAIRGPQRERSGSFWLSLRASISAGACDGKISAFQRPRIMPASPLTDHYQFDILHLAPTGRGDRMQLDQLNRRELIALIGGATMSWPLAARAQQAAMPVVGFLRDTSLAPFAHIVAPFRQGLKEAGFA